MKGIFKQYVFACSSYYDHCINCVNCSAKTTTIVADTEQEAIEKFKRIGGKVDFEKERIIPSSTFCALMGLNFGDYYDR